MTSFLSIEYKHGKSLRDFLRQLNKVRLQLKNYLPHIVLEDLVNGICHTHLSFSIRKYKPTSLNKILECIDKYII